MVFYKNVYLICFDFIKIVQRYLIGGNLIVWLVILEITNKCDYLAIMVQHLIYIYILNKYNFVN